MFFFRRDGDRFLGVLSVAETVFSSCCKEMLLQTLCLTLSAGAFVTFHRVQKLMYDHSVSLLVKLELMKNPWRSI